MRTRTHMAMFLFITLFCQCLTLTRASPMFIYSHKADLLGYQNEYISDSITTDDLLNLNKDSKLYKLIFNQNSVQTPLTNKERILSLILLIDESTATYATSNNWLKKEYTVAPSSVVLPYYTHDNDLIAKERKDVFYVKGTTNSEELVKEIGQTLLQKPTIRTIVVDSPPLKNAGKNSRSLL